MASQAPFPTQWLQPWRERNPPCSPVVADPLLPRPASSPPHSAPSSCLAHLPCRVCREGREALHCSCLESHVGSKAAHLSPQASPMLRSRGHATPTMDLQASFLSRGAHSLWSPDKAWEGRGAGSPCPLSRSLAGRKPIQSLARSGPLPPAAFRLACWQGSQSTPRRLLRG